MFKKKNLVLEKLKELFNLFFDLIKLELNLFVQEFWEQTVPIFPPIITIIIGLFLLFISLTFFGFTIASLFYLITKSYWLSFLITTLLLMCGGFVLIIASYFKLKRHKFNLEKTLKQLEKKDAIL